MTQPIVQFGTSRFLLAHADLFVSEALQGQSGAANALGGITIVQSTNSATSSARTAALTAGAGYPVVIRGLERGEKIDRQVQCTAVREALQATNLPDWQRLRTDLASGAVQVILSNTADKGYQLDAEDGPTALAADAAAPRSYPAKLLVLLHERWSHNPQAALSLLPCELIERNGDVLKKIVSDLAQAWQLPADFVQWISAHCVWANALVDRIVSEAIEPVGAVAEPYALWAIEAQDRLILPCTHPSIVVTNDLDHYEQLKLFLLNAAHTYLAERWLTGGRKADETVREAMQDAELRADLEALWAEEIVPVFGAEGTAGRAQAQQYVADVRERFENPFLNHRIADIAQNHAQKKERRLGPVVAKAEELGLNLPQLRLKAALARV